MSAYLYVLLCMAHKQGFPRIPNVVNTWKYHEPMGYLVMAGCLGSFMLACITSPGVVRPDRASVAAANAAVDRSKASEGERQKEEEAAGRHCAGGGGRILEIERRHADCYPHDGVVFVKGFCNTCRIPK